MQIGSDKLAGWLIQGKQVQFQLNYTTIQPGKRNILRLHKFYCFPNALYVNSVTAASYNNNKLISTKYWLVYSTPSIITLCLGYFVTLCRSASICRLFINKRDNLTFFVDTCGLMKGNLFREIISLIEYTQRTRWILIPRRRRRLTKRPTSHHGQRSDEDTPREFNSQWSTIALCDIQSRDTERNKVFPNIYCVYMVKARTKFGKGQVTEKYRRITRRTNWRNK